MRKDLGMEEANLHSDSKVVNFFEKIPKKFHWNSTLTERLVLSYSERDRKVENYC